MVSGAALIDSGSVEAAIHNGEWKARPTLAIPTRASCLQPGQKPSAEL